MDKKLSFREYIESKDILKSSLTKPPVEVKEYNISKYNKLINELNAISVKPNYKLEIKWEYENKEHPSILNFILYDKKQNKLLEKNDIDRLIAKKIKKWLEKHI